MKFTFDVQWQMAGTVTVEAETEEDAQLLVDEKISLDDLVKVYHCEYVGDSFVAELAEDEDAE